MKLLRNIPGLISASVCILLDRLTKSYACTTLASGSIDFIPGVLRWKLVRNQGVAFSMLSGRNLLLISMTAVLLIGICIFMIVDHDMPKFARAGLWMIFGGGIGNLFDRLVYGSVIDFIQPVFINFATFNVADIFVCTGCAMTLISLVFREYKERKNLAG